MKKAWVRILLWWNNICPEHGPLEYACGYDGGYHYCEKCNEARREDYKKSMERLQALWREL
jgi:hypothetical protein